MTVFWTVLSGVCVYVIGQVALKFLIDPLHALRETRGKIIDFLIQHKTRYTFPGTDLKNPILRKVGMAAEEWKPQLEQTKYRARELASELMVRANALPLYSLFETVRVVPSRPDIRLAHSELLDLSYRLLKVTTFEGTSNAKRAEKIKKALNIDIEFRADKDNSATSELVASEHDAERG